ncbi:MAG: copper chaperone PCu(A)C [Deltaproteobacteria bacterium]|nr:copper chaperone PCu(A)C [Deltaproteobacteria bacterium]
MFKLSLSFISILVFVFLMASNGIAGDIEIKMAWTRETPPNAPTGAAYMTIANHGTADDRLIETESNISERTELHMGYMEQGMMKMRKLNSIDMPAGKTVELKPGGYHVMFIGPKKQLTAGEEIHIVLKSETAGIIKVTAPVKKSDNEAGTMKMR